MDSNNQRVYPMDSNNSSMNFGSPDRTRYAMLSENGSSVRPPPYRQNIPLYPSKAPQKKGDSCIRCLLYCCCLLLILTLILVSIMISFFYGFYKPKVPSYKVHGLEVGAFNVQPDFSLYTEFIIDVKAENPNEKISITYEKDSSVIVTYSDSKFCSGKLPAFHQGQKNTTMMNVVLRGKSEFGSGIQEALMENRRNGRIPLVIMVKAPVSIWVGELAMREIDVLVKCSLVVDNLSPKKKIGIISSSYAVSISL